MANIKITELNEIATIDNNDVLPIVDVSVNETKKITKASLVNDVYSTSEVKTNKVWVNNKPIYKKTVYISALPNNTYDGYNAGLSNVDYIVDMYGQYQGSSSTTGNQKVTRPINFHLSNNDNHDIVTFYNIDTDQIRIYTLADMSFLSGYVTLEYTKTTD